MTRRTALRKKYARQKLITYILLGATLGIVGLFVIFFILFAWFSKDLPAPGKVQRKTGFSTVFADRDGKVIYELYKDQNRIPVSIKTGVSEPLQKATIAIEDKDFYTHAGFSSRGMVRAVFAILLKGRLEGGSTLTQQLVKNVLLTPERNIIRKIKEFILATEIERRYTKDEILEMYLNEAPYGGALWGVGAAAKGYFGKSAKDLNLVESAFLAGLPQRPSYYSPFIGKNNAYISRTEHVLRRMREDGAITKNVEKQAKKDLAVLTFTPSRLSIRAPHFVFYVRDEVAKLFGDKIIDQGVAIKTTLSLDIQTAVEEIVAEEIEKIKKLNATNAAVVLLESQTNEILAMVGSYDYNDKKFGNFNAATGRRQPGSSIKPITYALAFEKGYTPSTVLADVKTVFPNQGDKEYIPENYDGKFRGPVQFRFALGNSINVPAVKLLAMVGIHDFLQKAYDMGLDTLEPTAVNLSRFGLAVTLGGGEVRLVDLASAYAVFARGGVRRERSSILELKDYAGRRLTLPKAPAEKRVLSQDVSFLISHILSDNNARIAEFGPNSYLHIAGKTVAAKTGTTDDKRDNWTVGFTKGVTVGVWVGNNDNTPMNQKIASGVTGASPIWHRVMREVLKKYPDGIMDKPDTVDAFEIDAFLGGLPYGDYPKRSEYFIVGSEPKDIASFYKKLKISKNNGKIANDVEVRLGEYEEKNFIVLTENDPVSTDGKNRWQEGINAWAAGQNDDRYKAPTESSDTKSEDIVVSIQEPGDKSTLSLNTVTLKAKITSLSMVKKVEVFVNGKSVATYLDDRRSVEEPLSLSDGVYEIRVMAENDKGKTGDSKVTVGVNKPWDTVTPTPTASP